MKEIGGERGAVASRKVQPDRATLFILPELGSGTGALDSSRY